MTKKRIFITGSSRGIGYGLAKMFISGGHEVIINSNNIKNLKLASKKLNNCDYVLGDVCDLISVKKIVRKIRNNKKKLDVIICNYGNSNPKKNDLNFEHAIKHNFYSTTNIVSEGVSLLNKNEGKIICISSICGVEVIENAPIGYSLAKSLINNYVKSMSKPLGEKGISINAIAPGNILFDGSVWDKKIKENKNKTLNYINKVVPLKKFGTIQDIFEICEIIVKNRSQYMSGATYVLDGAQTNKF
jgi:NAD(P)-dependent dehydrogenase (short-subunit alcohol dehydrogenase family)|tara:strand:- start:956 stop:1690 length:735 start_codon:yes stop_codon:yes gene_type:complete